jgi:hypothetical protein
MFRVLRFLSGSMWVSCGASCELRVFSWRFLALASTQCNCVAPFWVFSIYTFLLIKKKKKKIVF